MTTNGFDVVAKPEHYNSHPSGVEIKDLTGDLDTFVGNIFKYVARHGLKGKPIEDLRKARQYAEFEIDRQTEEVWAPYYRDERYEVSTLGNVRNTKTGRRVKPFKLKVGYLAWTIYGGKHENGKTKNETHYVHVAVWETHVGPFAKGLQVCHRDGDADNCRITNLRVDTPAGNAADRDDHGNTARGQRNGNSRLTADQAEEIRGSTETLRVLAARFGVSVSAVHAVRTGRTWQNRISPRRDRITRFLAAEPEGYAKQIFVRCLNYPTPDALAEIIEILDYMIEIEQERLFAPTA